MAGTREAQPRAFNVGGVIQTVVAALIVSSIAWTAATVVGFGDRIGAINARLDHELALINGVPVRDVVVRLVIDQEYCRTGSAKIEAMIEAASKESHRSIAEVAKYAAENRSICERLQERIKSNTSNNR